ncbi:sulfite oxidase [soil metagenome]
MRGKREDMLVHEREPYNAEPCRAALDGSPLTPLDSFYSRNHGPVPDLDPATWRLTVDGLVSTELSLSVTDLQTRFERHELVATLQCAGNRRTGLLAVRDIPGEAPWDGGATGTASWAGVRLADVLAEAGVSPGAGHVELVAPDLAADAKPVQAFGGSVPLAKALAPEVLLAWEMNGAPLTRLHGAPVRVVVPGWIGARSVKWVERVTVRSAPSDNYFQATVYRLLPVDGTAAPGRGTSLGPVALNTEVLHPEPGSRVPAGALEVGGYAFAGDDRDVVRVDVSLDGGETWAQAHLGEDQGPWAWRLWRLTVEVPPGETRIVARAWDSTGATQPSSPAHVWNPKGYVNNSWADVTVTADRA